MSALRRGGEPRVTTGIEALRQQVPSWLRQRRVGLLMNQASLGFDFRSTAEILESLVPGCLVALFSPQHGIDGDKQDNMVESAHGDHPELGIPHYSLYSETREPSAAMLDGIDTLVIDLQDVGCRVYTFVWTLLACLKACAAAQIPVVVLDRPNPVGGVEAEGARLVAGFETFVGQASIPLRHGLTFGELGRFLNRTLGIGAELEVVAMTGWQRAMTCGDSGLPWTPPSPNLPRREGVLLYPGQVLLEGTNLSEGRGTTTPFEVCGAPFLDGRRWWKRAKEFAALTGVRARPVVFEPTFGKWAGQRCQGLFLHLTDADALTPVRLTYALLAAAWREWPDEVGFQDPPYEYERVLAPFDCITGSDQGRLALENVQRWDEGTLDALTDPGAGWWQEVAPDLLYRRAAPISRQQEMSG